MSGTEWAGILDKAVITKTRNRSRLHIAKQEQRILKKDADKMFHNFEREELRIELNKPNTTFISLNTYHRSL